jgi:hypothetical protein
MPGALLIAGLMAWFAFGDLFASHTITHLHKAWFILWRLGLLTACVLAVISIRTLDRSAARTALSTIAIMVTLGIIGQSAVTFITHDYKVRKTMDSSMTVTTAKAPQFQTRVASDVADASRRNDLGALTGIGDLGEAMYLADKGVYSTLVEKKASLGGYLAVEEQKIEPTGGNGIVTVCTFNQKHAARKLSGSFSHSLDRAIAHKARGTFFDTADAYGYCSADKTPMVVVPLQKMTGWSLSTPAPAGVALYNGTTGALRVQRNVTAGQIPGPVYPMSLAAQQRESSQAIGSFSDYWHKRSGFDPDPNTGVNNSEFALTTTYGRGVYVTPLISRNGSSVTALAVISSDEVHYGKPNRLVVHKFADDEIRMGTSKATAQIQAVYSYLNEWANKKNTMEVAELTPVSQTQWIATLAQGQVVDYRVTLNADTSSCLYAADGTKLRCVDASGKITFNNQDATTAQQSNGDAPITGSTGQPGATQGLPAGTTLLAVPTGDKALRKMTTQQLVRLSAAVAQELANRAQPQPGQ